MILAKGYTALGEDRHAFTLLENYFLNKEPNVSVLEALEPLYNKINGKMGDWNAYRNKITGTIQNELKAKFKEEMILEKAAAFTLTDMAGKMVSLSDYKGKIVILDFWATWCGPCVGSFPGMQLAVNKYKNDPGVEFLFVNTRQREENYKDVVIKFMANTKYNFHVAYDEMKDASKSTITAYKITGIPTKIFIDPQGMIRFRAVGGHLDIGTVVSEIDARIALMKEAIAIK
ncbi:Thiol-disulfide oxidoreductase ResA [compost metagenome]